MKATLVDLRRNLGKIVEAIERKETVTLTFRGREIATIVPKTMAKKRIDLRSSPAFGMWRDREEMKDPTAYVRALRGGK